jgi:hypothetical protein
MSDARALPESLSLTGSGMGAVGPVSILRLAELPVLGSLTIVNPFA